MAHRYMEATSKFLCAGLLLFQGLMIDAYLVKLHCVMWWCWCVTDACVILTWACCLWHTRRRHHKKYSDVADQVPHEIKYTYIGWIVYIALIVPRIVLLFKHLAMRLGKEEKALNEEDILGPNYLKMALSCMPIIYFLLVYGSHVNTSRTPKHIAVRGIAITGAFDLFDSIELLEFLFLPEEGVFPPPKYLIACLVFACISMFLPALSLYGLKFKAKPGRVSSLTFKIVHEFLNLVVINLPNLIIRSILWHEYSLDVSVLLMKNVMGIIAGLYEILEYFGEYRPIACKKCDDWFERSAYRKHKESCACAVVEVAQVAQVEETGKEFTAEEKETLT